jgi:hypothetical protein
MPGEELCCLGLLGMIGAALTAIVSMFRWRK